MNNIKVYTKPTRVNGCFRISTIDTKNARVDSNTLNIVMQLLRLKEYPEAQKKNFAYTFGLNFGG